jgi:FkbM family methyltransferase
MTRPYYYLGGNRALTQLSTGQPFFINTDDRGITTWIILGGLWETFVDDVLSRLAKPGMNFLDIGANMGYYSVKIGGLVGPTGKIFSFEPNPELYPFLRDNIDINGFRPRAELFQLALGDADGRGELKFTHENMGGGHLFAGGAGSRSVPVDLGMLDNFISKSTKIDLMKIDAEGYEPRILAGGKRVLNDNPEAFIVLEVSIANWRLFGNPEETLQQLAGTEKEIFQIETSGAVRPMGSAYEFLARIDDKFVSYCLVAPRASSAREVLVDLIRQ